jgi:CHAT domain-containing protein
VSDIRDRHLNIEDLQLLAQVPVASAGTSGTDSRVLETREHLLTCPECKELAESQAPVVRELSRLRHFTPGVRMKDCPAESDWMNLAAGVTRGEGAIRLLQHAVQCDFCGNALRIATEIFNDEISVDENGLMTTLGSSLPERQTALSSRLAKDATKAAVVTGIPTRNTSSRKWNWLLVPAFASVIIVAFVLWDRANSIESQLASAYAEQRQIEMRIAGARYGKLRTQRGASGSRLDHPAALLQAEAKIAGNLQKRPHDARWLEAKGTADLLEWDYNSAIRSFERAMQSQPDTTTVQVNLAVAYFERGEADANPSDYARAVEVLSAVLAHDPNHQEALFNRSIALEKLALPLQAIKDCEDYLRVDSNGPWSTEVRARLQRLRSANTKSGPVDDGAVKHVLSFLPAAIGAAPASIDVAVDMAVRRWLIRAFPPEAEAKADPSLRQAVHQLGTELRRSYRDAWLDELMRSSHNVQFPGAIKALVEAVEANATGDPATAAVSGNAAERRFERLSSPAGISRARFEQIYALQRSSRGTECEAASRALLHYLHGRHYRWLELQTRLELTICAALDQQFQWSLRAARDVTSQAQSSPYHGLYLRSLGTVAGLQQGIGDFPAAWATCWQGLQAYRPGQDPPMRAYQFLDVMSYVAEDRGYRYVPVHVLREAVTHIARSDNVSGEAMATYRLARALQRSGDSANAATEYRHSSALFARFAPSQALSLYKTDGDIGLAELELERGNYQRALAALTKVDTAVFAGSQYDIPLHYYQVVGRAQFAAGQYDVSEKSLLAALQIAGRGLKSLPDRRERDLWWEQVSPACRALVNVCLRTRSSAAALRLWEWLLRAGSIAGVNESGRAATKYTNPDLGSLLKKVSEQAASGSSRDIVVSYAQLPEGLAAWSDDGQSVDFVWIRLSAHELEQLTDNFLRSCGTPSSDLDSLRREAHQLYTLLLRPFEARLCCGRALVVSPDGPLSRLPFSALVDDSGRYLGERFDIRLRSSVARISPDPGPVTPATPAVIVGATTSDAGKGLPPLADAGREARAVAGKFRNVRLLVDKDATREALVASLPGAGVFHFAGHSIPVSDREELMMKITGPSPSSSLDATGLGPGACAACRLVVLAACSTNRASDRASAIAYSVPLSFLRAGVRDVVATNWDIDSEETARYMEVFYEVLLSGHSTNRALANAAAKIREDPNTRHPYYWASFVLYASA